MPRENPPLLGPDDETAGAEDAGSDAFIKLKEGADDLGAAFGGVEAGVVEEASVVCPNGGKGLDFGGPALS